MIPAPVFDSYFGRGSFCRWGYTSDVFRGDREVETKATLKMVRARVKRVLI